METVFDMLNRYRSVNSLIKIRDDEYKVMRYRASTWHGVPVKYVDAVREALKGRGFRIRYRGPRPDIHVYRGLVRRADCSLETATTFAVYFRDQSKNKST